MAITLDGLYRLHAEILQSFPSAYPRARLIVHESSEALVQAQGDTRHSFNVANGFHPALCLAQADVRKSADRSELLYFVHIAAPVLKEEPTYVLGVLLHEYGHLRSAQLHGADSDAFLDEARADAFGRRWQRKLEPAMRRPKKRKAE